MRLMRFGILMVVVACALAIAGTRAEAGITNYSDQSAETVSYLDINEASATDGVALYGAPEVVAGTNRLVFSPVVFAAFTAGGGADITSGTLELVIDAGDLVLTSVSVREFGDVFLAGTGGAPTQASWGGMVAATDLDNFGGALQASAVLEGDGPTMTYNLVEDAGTSLFSGETVLDLTDLNTTRVRLVINNNLAAFSELASSALIQKKGFEVEVATGGLIPEPATAMLLVSAGGMLIWRRRR